MIYDYKCSECGHEFQRVLKLKDMDLPKHEPCPSCGKEDCIERYIATPVRTSYSYNQHSKGDDTFQKHVLAPILDKVPKHLRADTKYQTKREW